MPASPESDGSGVTITIDHRERPSGLVDLLVALWPSVQVGTLVVGDAEIGRRVLVERKTVDDLVASVKDGRLFRQLFAMCGEASRPLLVIEGPTPIPAAGLEAESLRGILLSVAIGYRVPMLRTMSTQETAIYLARIAQREARRRARAGAGVVAPAGPLSVLAAVPGVGEERAAALLGHFGSLRAIFGAPQEDLRAVHGIGPGLARQIHQTGTSSSDRNPPGQEQGMD